MSSDATAHEWLYTTGTSAPVTTNREEASEAKRSRKWLLAQLRNAVLADGAMLASMSDESSFSKHGSLYHRLHSHRVNDIDMYVVLNGRGLIWGDNISLWGVGNSNINIQRFARMNYEASALRGWMLQVVRVVLGSLGSQHKASLTRRGASIQDLGGRNYDIIPAFAFKDEQDNLHHLIPNDQVWQANPTTLDMQFVIFLDREFRRDVDRLLLGYRDLVKLLKKVAEHHQWKETRGITSFMIRFAAANELMIGRASNLTSNQARLGAILANLDGAIDRRYFVDPYTGEHLPLHGLGINGGDCTLIRRLSDSIVKAMA